MAAEMSDSEQRRTASAASPGWAVYAVVDSELLRSKTD